MNDTQRDRRDFEVSLKDYIERIMREQDRVNDIRFKASETAVNAALAAQEKAVGAAFTASERAITKAEDAQKSYNANHNDLSRKMDEQYKQMIPRTEAIDKIEAVVKELTARADANREQIGLLREANTASAARGSVVDPQMAEELRSLTGEVKRLREAAAVSVGKSTGLGSAWAYLLGAVGLAGTIFGIVMATRPN